MKTRARAKGIAAVIAVMAIFSIFIEPISVRAETTGEILGRVQMTDLCSPRVSPAVVLLNRQDVNISNAVGTDPSSRPMLDAGAAGPSPVLITLKDLQFAPRVLALAQGRAVRLDNSGDETHSVRVEGPDLQLVETLGPGRSLNFTPGSPGVVTLSCDTHVHMRGFVIVSSTPAHQVCSPEGRYHLKDIEPGRYRLIVWHEMGESHEEEVVLHEGEVLKLPKIVLEVDLSLGSKVRKEIQSTQGVEKVPIRPWSRVLDRISVLLAAGLDAATQSRDVRRASRPVEDAYWGEFEASNMELAVRRHVGFRAAHDLVRRFIELQRCVIEVAENQRPPAEMARMNRDLLLALLDMTRELNRQGVLDNAELTDPGRPEDPALRVRSLRRDFHRVEFHAGRRVPEDAVAEFERVHAGSWRRIRPEVLGRDPITAWAIEERLGELRGDLETGLCAEPLTRRLTEISGQIDSVLEATEPRPGDRFAASLATLLREAMPAILALTLVFVLATPGSVAAAWWGIALGIGSGLLLSTMLRLLIGSGIDGGATTGLAGVAIAGVLVTLARRSTRIAWHEGRVPVGTASVSSAGSLTVFLAAWLIGTRGTISLFETFESLSTQRQTALAQLALIGGVVVGLALMALASGLVRMSLRRMPVRRSAAVSALVLALLAICMVGRGVFDFQNSGMIGTTNLPALGRGLGFLGIYTSLQVVVAQAALLALVLIPPGRRRDGTILDEPVALERSFLADGKTSELAVAKGRR